MSIQQAGAAVSGNAYQAGGADNNKSKTLGKDAFLNLLVAQLNNQDPLAPQGNSEFVAQLAQFSQVEGLQKLDESMAALLIQQQSAQALHAASLVGKQVLLVADTMPVNTGESFKGSARLPVASSHVQVNVYDEAGALVRTLDLGEQKPGEIPFEWDGKDDKGEPLPSGSYRFEAKADYEGGSKDLYTLLPAQVEAVRLASGEVYLKLAGVGTVPMSSVLGISQ